MKVRVFFVVFGLGLVAQGWSESTVRPQILSRKPHDNQAFTQGLLIDGEHWLESTGLYG